MPFSGPSSYLETIDEFIGHWTDVNLALTPDLILPGGYTAAMLLTDRTALAADITALEAAINTMEGHRTARYNKQPPIRERMRQLSATVKGTFADSDYVGQVQPLVRETAHSGLWIIAMDDMAHLWTTMNATPPSGLTPPLLLTGAYAIATFNTDVASLKTTYTALTGAEQDVVRELDERDSRYRAIRDHLVHYRAAVPGYFAADHPLVLSLPRLAPLPGHTPDAVVLSGVWNDATDKGDFTWTASEDPDLESYQIRRDGSAPYNGNTEQAVATLPPGTLAFSTNAGLTVGGSTMGFKVYVKLTTGNERGSNAVSVTNPDDGPP